MPRIASITTQSFTGVAVSSGLKLVEEFLLSQSQTATGVTAATGVHMGNNGNNLQVTGDGIITQYTTNSAFSLQTLTLDDTFDPTDNAGGAAVTGGINWDASGRNFYISEASQIEQYSVLTGDEYSITNRLAIVSNAGSYTNPVNMQMAPDDVTVLVAYTNQILQYDIDPFYVRNIAFATATGDSLAASNCVGIAYYNNGNSLLVAQNNGNVLQYELATAYSIADGTTLTSILSTGVTLAGISCAGGDLYLVNNTNTVYRYR